MKDEQKLQLNNLIELLSNMERYHKASIQNGLVIFDLRPVTLSEYFSYELQSIQKALKLAKNIRDCPSSIEGDWQHK